MSDDEIIVSGSKAIKLLSLSDFPEANLFGAEVYDGNDACVTQSVLNFNNGEIATAEKIYPLSWLNRSPSELIFTKPSQQLHELLRGTVTVGEARLETVNDQLKAIGFPVTVGTIELEEREFALKVMESDAVPSERERSKFFDIAKRAEPVHWAVRHFERWLLNLERGERFDPVGRMHLCYCFRHTRQLEKAVKASVVIEIGGRFKASPHLISIIATIRAASLLDIFELHNDPEILPIAQKTLGKAWANQKSQEAASVYKRLDALKRIFEEQNYKKRINAAYVDWASWL
jgi:hypothetical protein